jgi:hypothetical protein
MRKLIIALFLVTFCCVESGAQYSPVTKAQKSSGSQKDTEFVTNSILDNWFLQFGFDMSLQNPYGYDFSNVFPNGKSYGIDFAFGRSFTPALSVRGKFNWENGLVKNNHATWLAPFGDNGINHHKGGYIAMLGDIMFNIHNLFFYYDAERIWNFLVYPRAGLVYNFGVSKGSPLLGIGLGNTFKLNDQWSAYVDIAYQMTSSGFVGVVKNTGVGSNSNGYFDINVGVQLNLGENEFKRVGNSDKNEYTRHAVVINSFWSNWFVQAGLDMTLQNPYGCNFSHVFPNGKSFGIDAALGKWFSPEMALRGKINWENGLIENKHLTWVAPEDRPGYNYEKHGYVLANIDLMLNVQNIFLGYDEKRIWHLSPYARAGLIHNFAIDSASPVVGLGIENTYRLNERLSLYGDVSYQVTTSESSAGSTGMTVSFGCNGFFDIGVGVQIDLGSSNKFRRIHPNE